MIFPVCPKKGRKEISEPENHRFRGLKKKKTRIQEQLLLVPLVLKTLKNQRFSIKNRKMNWQFYRSGYLIFQIF
jgi:hypothetical protein